jgi:hypothetical protein
MFPRERGVPLDGGERDGEGSARLQIIVLRPSEQTVLILTFNCYRKIRVVRLDFINV